MKRNILTLILFILLLSNVNGQSFGCFTEPHSGWDMIHGYNANPINYDSIFWAQYKIDSVKNGYFIAKWDKYRMKMEGNIINGNKNGEWKIYEKNTNSFYKGNYIDNQKNGKWKYFEIRQGGDTVLNLEISYLNDLKEGKCTSYFRNALIYSIENYKSGKLEGEQTVYSLRKNSTISLYRITNYQNNKRNGIEKVYNIGNKGNTYLRYQKEYLNDQEKYFILFSEKGDTLELTSCYNDSYYDLFVVKQIKSGEKLLLSHYQHNGDTIDIEYSKKGDTASFKYIHDNYGIYKIFSNDSIDKKWKIDRIFHYKDGMIDGSYQKYYNNGQLAYEIIFKQGLLYTAVGCYTKDGQKIDIGNLKEGCGTLNFYYSDGKLKSSFTYENSICNGRISRYFNNGDYEIEGNMYNVIPSKFEFSVYSDEGDDINFYYLNRNLYGNIKSYYENHSKQIVITYDTISKITYFQYFYDNGKLKEFFSKTNNNFIGKYITYLPNGNIENCGKYILDNNGFSVKDSIWSYYSTKGILKATIFYKMGEKSERSQYYDNSGLLRRIEVINNDGSKFDIFDSDTVNLSDKNNLKQGKWISFQVNI
jgi:antitoxin component YwqK of YwqJK toxin-antitoxin module